LFSNMKQENEEQELQHTLHQENGDGEPC